MHKTIDINQRIPLDVLHVALESYLNGTYSNDYIIEQLRLEYSGENRIKKSLRIVNKIVPNNPIIAKLSEHPAEVKNALKKRTDRNVILIALLCSAFPFAFDALQTFGKFFLVQDTINSETIKKSISAVYGGNRATENGIYSVVPMFLEAGFFERTKPGLYSVTKMATVVSEISITAYKESFIQNNGILLPHHELDPYINFLQQE